MVMQSEPHRLVSPFSTYLKWVSTLLLLCLALTAAINVLVDPYAVFGSSRHDGFNTIKPFAVGRGRMSKPYEVLRARPAGLIIGNSRPEMGIDPTHACWPDAARPLYNMALPGLAFYKQVRYAQHAFAAGQVNTLLVAVDFYDFVEARGDSTDPTRWPPVAADELPLLVDANAARRGGFTLEHLLDLGRSAFSLSALAHSAMTVQGQANPYASTRSVLGFNHAEGVYQGIIDREGQRVLFEQKNRAVMQNFTREEWTLAQGGVDWNTSFEALSRLLEQANAQDIAVTVFINPYHAHYLVSIDVAGLWDLFEQWKRQLLDITTKAAVPLWDFAAFNRYSTESPGAVASRGEALEWFHEPAHYRQALGDRALERMYPGNCAAPEGHPDLGLALDATNMDAHLAQQRAEKARFVLRAPQVAAQLAAMGKPG